MDISLAQVSVVIALGALIVNYLTWYQHRHLATKASVESLEVKLDQCEIDRDRYYRENIDLLQRLYRTGNGKQKEI